MKRISISLFILTGMIYCSCQRSSSFTEDCSGTAKSFKTDVLPIIQATCATSSGCHASGSKEGPGALTSYSLIYQYRSAIYTAVKSASMPQSATLTSAQKSAIMCWIDNGASDN